MSPDREEFIAAMRGVASSVSVVTTDGAGGRHGATVSAFCAVSADPPALLVCLRADSRIARTVLDNGVFCVNVLGDSADAVADRFAGRLDTAGADRFAGLAVCAAGDGTPVLGVAASAFSCAVEESIASGSHVVVIGRVLSVIRRGDRPLAYLDGGYASVSRQAAAPQR